MPQGDRTGPQGQGPKTGKGQGKCGKGTRNPSQGGIGSGRGGGKSQGQGRCGGRGQSRGGGSGQGRGNR